MVNLFQAPVPGQALTDSPRNAPWERPAEYNTVEEVVGLYIKNIAKDDVLDDIAVAFELGADLKTMTETIMLSGAMKGVHTVEVGMLAGPVVASFIKAAMVDYGVDVPETSVSFEEHSTIKERSRLAAILQAAVEDGLAEDGNEGDAGISMLQEAIATTEQPTPDEAVVEEEQKEAPKPSMGKGLMSRGGME
jgi:hypothetical protein